MKKDGIIKFLKIYLTLFLCAIAFNLSMEILIPTPEEKLVLPIVIFYSLFSIIGAMIFFFKNYKPMKMGFLSLILGFIFEFTFMRPDWVNKIYAIKIEGDVIGAVIVTAFYWFIAWGIPSYIIHKYLIKSGTP